VPPPVANVIVEFAPNCAQFAIDDVRPDAVATAVPFKRSDAVLAVPVVSKVFPSSTIRFVVIVELLMDTVDKV
jgi:hypothetical protein